MLHRLDTESGEVNWVRHPPTGEVKLDHATAGGGLLVSNAGRLVNFDVQGFCWMGNFIAVEDGAPNGRGSLP